MFIRLVDFPSVVLNHDIDAIGQSKIVVIMDLDQTVIDRVTPEHMKQFGITDICLDKLQDYMTNKLNMKVHEVTHDRKKLYYIVRPDFESLVCYLQSKAADIIVFTHSDEDLANLLLSNILKLQVKMVKGRRQGTPPTAKCLAQLGDLSQYDHIIILDDDPNNFIELGPRIHRPPVTPFYWRNSRKDNNLAVVCRSIQSLL